MKKIIYAYSFIIMSLASCAQYGVVRSNAYYYEFMPGAIAVDDKGVEISAVDTIYSVFLETKKTDGPLWKTAWVNGKTYQVLSSIVTTPYIVGMRNDADEQVTLSAKPGNQLMQLNLEKTEASIYPSKYKSQLLQANTILLEGTRDDKKVYLVVKQPAHLRGKEYQ